VDQRAASAGGAVSQSSMRDAGDDDGMRSWKAAISLLARGQHGEERGSGSASAAP